MKGALQSSHNLLARYSLLPSFDEDTIFLLAVVVVLVWSVDPDARVFAEQVRANSSKITLIVLLGIGFAFYTAFFTNFKNEIQKFYMFWFAVIINFLSAFAAINILNDSDPSLFAYITPSVNIGVLLLMIVFWHADILDASSVPHKSSSYSNILYGTLVVLGFTLVSEYIFDISWPTVLSIAIGYATVFNKSVSKHLPRIFSQRQKKIEALDKVVNEGVEHMLQILSEGGEYGVSIVTDEGIKDLNVPSEYEHDIETFLADEVRKINRTNAFISVASTGTYTFKRYWFSPAREEIAIVIDAYPNDHSTGYQFCQMVKYNSEDILERYRGLMYQNKVTNIFT